MSSFQSILLIGINVIFWIAFCYLLISLFENTIHKYFMHKKEFYQKVYEVMPYLIDVFEAHAVRHHTIWYRKFDYEPDPVGREDNLAIISLDVFAMLIVTSPIWLTLMWFNVLIGSAFISMFFIHQFLWNVIHRQMHIPEDVAFRKWGSYRFLARHHFLHHQDTDKNFNVVAPLADFVLGTVGKPELKDIREMLRLGYLLPRSARIQKRFQEQGLPVLGANHS